MDSTVEPPPTPTPAPPPGTARHQAGSPRGPHADAGPDPAPAASPAAVVPGLGDWPVRPRSPGISRRARRRALRMRIARAAAVLAVAAGMFATVAVAASPSRTTSRPLPPPTPDTPLPRVTTPPIPLAPVGVDGKAWVQYQGWCVGDITREGDVIGAETCRFLPEPGRIDVTVLKPGRYAPPGHSLVVVVVVGQAWPRLGYHATMSDLDSSNAMVLDRPAGLLGVVFLWGYTRGGQIDITVTHDDGDPFASCRDCAHLDN